MSSYNSLLQVHVGKYISSKSIPFINLFVIKKTKQQFKKTKQQFKKHSGERSKYYITQLRNMVNS